MKKIAEPNFLHVSPTPYEMRYLLRKLNILFPSPPDRLTLRS